LQQEWFRLERGNYPKIAIQKKVLTTWGKVELPKSHILCQGTSKFAITERLRELACLTGQAEVYDQASELLDRIGGVSISGMQIKRLCTYYGSLLDPLIKANYEAVIPQLPKKSTKQKVYVMVDGAMLSIRPNEWREIKLGRVFTDDNIVQLSESRREARQSIYVNHLGRVNEFFPKLERHLVNYPHKVIVGDGAKWIWNWAEDNYPGAVQILDFYHAKEKLVEFARYQWKDETKRSAWLNDQLGLLRNNGVELVRLCVKSCRASNQVAKEAKEKLLRYYLEHEDRMQYKTYREQGLLIGSGPIEAAHRGVIQQRMKRSGQKWSENGAQAMANLRCFHASRAWSIVQKVIQAA